MEQKTLMLWPSEKKAGGLVVGSRRWLKRQQQGPMDEKEEDLKRQRIRAQANAYYHRTKHLRKDKLRAERKRKYARHREDLLLKNRLWVKNHKEHLKSMENPNLNDKPDVILALAPVTLLDGGPRASSPTISEVSKMLDSLLEVQHVLTKHRDHKRLELLHSLTSELQDDYLALLEAVTKAV